MAYILPTSSSIQHPVRRVSRRDFIVSGSSLLFLPLLRNPLLSIEAAKSRVEFWPLLGLLGGFASDIFADVASTSISRWIANFESNGAVTRVNDINQKMESSDFREPEGGATVYQVGVSDTCFVHFYGFENLDGFNACAPFIGSFLPYRVTKDYTIDPLVEGPIIYGLAMAARDWYGSAKVQQNKIKKVDGLLPLGIKPSQYGQGSQLEYPFEEPFVYCTNAGTLEIGYSVPTQDQGKTEGKGTVQVLGKDINHEVVFDANYDMRWQL